MGKEIAELKEQAVKCLNMIEDSHEYYSQVCDIKKYIEELEAAQPRWISVKDTPVPKIIMVLGYNVKENYFVGWLDRKGRWHVLGQLDYAYDVTHWMNLPPAPEEEE